MTDTRPSECRNRRRDESKPYPRSGCVSCRDGGLFGCPHERRPAQSYPHVADTEIIAREHGINDVMLTRHIEGHSEPARSEGLGKPGLVSAQLLSDARRQLFEMKEERDRFAAMTAPPDLAEFLRVSGRQFEAYQAMAERALKAEAEVARLRPPEPVPKVTVNTETGCIYPGPCGWQGDESKGA